MKGVMTFLNSLNWPFEKKMGKLALEKLVFKNKIYLLILSNSRIFNL